MLETKSISALAFQETAQQRLKRKREQPPLTSSQDVVAAAAVATTTTTTATSNSLSCFSNAAFSSTPKKIIGRPHRRIRREENTRNPFHASHDCLEIKSIQDLTVQQPQTINPFEVVRNPPKKKKKTHEIACFENPALNLDLPEKQFNPFEVQRSLPPPAKCFINEALNLRGNDVPATLNPYEIPRNTPEINTMAEGVVNPSLGDDDDDIADVADIATPAMLKIGIPFVPNVNCRIDFQGMSPSKLLLEKLIFSPVQPMKRSLGVISEENSTMDIGKELDRYQLELENSINEAKLRKEAAATQSANVELLPESNQTHKDTNDEEINQNQLTEQLNSNNNNNINNNNDVEYASSDSEEEEKEENEDELQFKAPARFVRNYRPAGNIQKQPPPLPPQQQQQIIGSKESLNSNESKPHHNNVTHIIRQSIRKLMHNNNNNNKQQQQQVNDELKQTTDERAGHKENKNSSSNNNIINNLRQSLRRRQPKAAATQEQREEKTMPADISIIDTSERTIKLRSCEPQTEYMRIEQLTNERKHTLRNSIRRSTRDVLRHVFHQKAKDTYATAK